jgi:hypothetical protein
LSNTLSYVLSLMRQTKFHIHIKAKLYFNSMCKHFFLRYRYWFASFPVKDWVWFGVNLSSL